MKHEAVQLTHKFAREDSMIDLKLYLMMLDFKAEELLNQVDQNLAYTAFRF